MSDESTVLLEVEWKREGVIEPPGYKVTANVIRNENIQENIFVYQQNLGGDTEFYSIATADQLVSIPVNVPAPGSVFFLGKSFSKSFSTAKEMLSAEDEYKFCIQRMIDDWNILQGDIISTYTKIFTPDNSEET